MGLLDTLNTPAGMGLLSALAGGLAGARRGQPINNVGRGAVSGLMGYSNAQDQIRADEENAFQKQFKQAQLDDYKRKAAEAEAQRAWRAGLPDYLRPQTKYVVGDQQFGSQQEAQAAAMPNENTQLMAGAMGSQAASQPVQEINAVRDPAELQAYMMQPGSPYADKFIEGMIPKPPKWAMGERFNEATGLPEKVIYDENDPTKVMPFGGQKSNIPEGMQLVDGKLAPIPGYLQMRSQIAAAGAPQFITYGAPQPVINPATGKAELAQFGNRPGAGPKFTGVAPAPDAKPPTEAEAKAAFYAGNMRAASDVLDNLEKQGFDPTTTTNQAGTALAGGLTNPLTGQMAQQARQAQNQWAEQMLRMQTGAAATTDEVNRTVRTYFPAVGDTPEVIAQKRHMRQQAESGVVAASGRAADRIPTAKPKAGAFADAEKERRYQEWKRSQGK